MTAYSAYVFSHTAFQALSVIAVEVSKFVSTTDDSKAVVHSWSTFCMTLWSISAELSMSQLDLNPVAVFSRFHERAS